MLTKRESEIIREMLMAALGQCRWANWVDTMTRSNNRRPEEIVQAWNSLHENAEVERRYWKTPRLTDLTLKAFMLGGPTAPETITHPSDH